MHFLIAVAVAAVVIPQSAFSRGPLSPASSLLVRAVIDGDTIDVIDVGRVRLLGIDAPEMGRGLATAAPFAREAKDRLTALVWHHWIRLEQDAERFDVYNRHLAYVMTDDGQFVNAMLVREGLARVSARTPIKRLDELKRAEGEAQAFRRGIWGGTPSVPSTGYTRPPAGSGPQTFQGRKPASRPKKGSESSTSGSPASKKRSRLKESQPIP